MKIKLLVSRAGIGFAQNRGDVIDVEAAEGARMVEAGQAEIVREAVVERAVRPAKAEKAAR
jgi:hypothetical protein